MAGEGLIAGVMEKAAEEAISRNFTAILSKIYTVGTKYYEEYSIISGNGLRKYYESVINKYYYVKSIIDSKTKMPLSEVYVAINLESEKETINSRDVRRLLEDYPHFVISGLAGAGKTTLTKYLFIESIKSALKIPILIELRNIKYKDSLLESMREYLDRFNLKISSELFDNLLHKGLFTFFFDGLDEMPIAQQKEFSAELAKFRDKYHSNFIIVISRPFEILKSYEGFEILSIKKLDLNQAVLLIEKLNYDKEIKDKFISLLKSKLFAKHRSFAQNPLLLTIMLMTYDQNADIPEKLHEFYQMAYEALYQRHDATKGGAFHRDTHCRLNMLDFEKVLSCFCYHTLYQGLIILDYEQLINNIKKTKVYFSDYCFSEKDFSDDLIQSVCLIIQEGFNYQFVHRSFQEYFSAKFISTIIAEDKVAKVLQKFSTKIALRDTLNLIFEMKPIYIEKYYILPIIEYINALIKESGSICIFVGKYIISKIVIYFDDEMNRISWFGANNTDYFLLGDIMFIADKFDINKAMLTIDNLGDLKKYKDRFTKKDGSDEYVLDCTGEYFNIIFNKFLPKLNIFFERDIKKIEQQIRETIMRQDTFIDELLI